MGSLCTTLGILIYIYIFKILLKLKCFKTSIITKIIRATMSRNYLTKDCEEQQRIRINV